MPNRTLTQEELRGLFGPLFADVKSKLDTLSGGDPALLFALRRKLKKELEYLERGKPMERRVLKAAKRAEQHGTFAICGGDLPEKDAELDRIEAMAGYTMSNTRLVHQACHRSEQAR